MKFPQYISTNERTVRVVGYVDKENTGKETGVFEDGKGYIAEDESIWIFCGGGKPSKYVRNQYPYFWFNKNSEKEFSEPSELIKKAFSISNLKDLSIVNIVDKTEEGVQLFDEKEINDMNSAAAVFVPLFSEKDDFLKRLVKTIIIEKGIDINKLKSKAKEDYAISNMRAALTNSTKMSVKYFITWLDLLGCDFELTIVDNGLDKVDKLKKPIIYQSKKDTVSSIEDNGELTSLNTGKFSASEEE